MIRHRDKEKEIDVVYYLHFNYTTLAIFLVYFADADAHNQDINRQIFRMRGRKVVFTYDRN